MQVHLRKPTAGGSSHGYEWPEDGAVVPVTPEHAAELLAIRDAGFEVVDPPEDDDSDDEPDDTEGPAKPRPARRRKPAVKG